MNIRGLCCVYHSFNSNKRQGGEYFLETQTEIQGKIMKDFFLVSWALAYF